MPLLRNLTVAHIKDYVSIGAGLAAILGGLITGAAIFFGGNDSPEAAAGPTATPTPSGEFLRVQFGTQQDPSTFLPAGDTVSPGDDIEVCPGESLFAWVYHSFEPPTVVDTRFSDRAGVLFAPSIPVDPGQVYVWVSVNVADTGEHTLSVSQQGGAQHAQWSVNVTCAS